MIYNAIDIQALRKSLKELERVITRVVNNCYSHEDMLIIKPLSDAHKLLKEKIKGLE